MWRTIPVTTSIINGVIMTSLLLLKDYLCVSQLLDLIRQEIQQYVVTMTSNDVVVSITLYLDVGNGEYTLFRVILVAVS